MITKIPKKPSDFNNWYKEAITILDSIDLQVIDAPKIELNPRLTRAMGRYWRGKNTIEMSKKFFIGANKDEIINVFIHELVHHLDKSGDRSLQGHGKEWQRIAKIVTDNTQYKITRYCQLSEEVKEVLHSYKVVCSNCDQVYSYARKPKWWDIYNKCICPNCHAKGSLIRK